MSEEIEMGTEVWGQNGNLWSGPYKYVCEGTEDIYKFYNLLVGDKLERFAAITTTNPHEEKRPDYLQEGEELWEYCEKYKQYKDPLHVDGTLEEYQLSGAEGSSLIGFVVLGGNGNVEILNHPHWFTGENAGTAFFRDGDYTDKAKIIGAVMRAGE